MKSLWLEGGNFDVSHKIEEARIPGLKKKG